jgi:hypothetical protein
LCAGAFHFRRVNEKQAKALDNISAEKAPLTKLQFAVTNRRSGRYGNTSGISPSRSFRCTLRQKSG